jgi:ABC-2 type transport system ATP-binding protein
MVAEGVTVVVSTSYLDEAERCDRVVLMNEGRTLALDRPAVLQASLEGSMLALRADRPRDARDVLRTAPAVRAATLFGDTVHALVSSDADAKPLADVLRREGISVLSIEAIEPSLEDLFIHLVGTESPTDGAAARV